MKKTFNIEIGNRVRLARKRMNLTREQLANLVGISPLFVGYIECGQKGMSLETLSALSQVLHVSCDYLLNGVSPDAGAEGSQSELHRLVNLTPEELRPLLKEQIQLFLRTAGTAKTASRKEPAGEVLLYAARGGKNREVILSEKDRERLRELLSAQSGKDSDKVK